MNIKKLYNSLSVSEKEELKNLILADFSDKTPINEFIKKYEEELQHSVILALNAVYIGSYRYKCHYIEDLIVENLRRFSGIGESRIRNLKYLIRKHKANNK